MSPARLLLHVAALVRRDAAAERREGALRGSAPLAGRGFAAHRTAVNSDDATAGARPSAQIQPSVPRLNSTRWVRVGFRQAGSRMVSAAAAVALCAPGLLLGAAPLTQSSIDGTEQPDAAPRPKPPRLAR